MNTQNTGGARPKTTPPTPATTPCSVRHWGAIWIHLFAVKTTTGANKNGNVRNWHSTQSNEQTVRLLICPACGKWCTHSSQLSPSQCASGCTWKDDNKNIGRNTANSTTAEICRLVVIFIYIFEVAKLQRIIEWEKNFYLFFIFFFVLFLRGADFPTILSFHNQTVAKGLNPHPYICYRKSPTVWGFSVWNPSQMSVTLHRQPKGTTIHKDNKTIINNK